MLLRSAKATLTKEHTEQTQKQLKTSQSLMIVSHASLRTHPF
jgi:hypothetical protein